MDCHDTLQKIGSEVCMISVVIFIFLIGMCIASFAGLCADRLPVHKSVITGRSHCDHCDHVLAWYDLLPVVGYVLCKGRCRYCGKELKWTYPLEEMAGGVMACICYMHYGNSILTLSSFVIVMTLYVISIVDFKTMVIYDSTVIVLAIAGIVHVLCQGNVDIKHILISMMIISVPMYLINLFIKNAFGMGDVELMAISGIFLTPMENVLAFMIGEFMCGVVCMYMLMNGRRDRNTHVPFAPYLSIGIVLSMLYGTQMIMWYLTIWCSI